VSGWTEGTDPDCLRPGEAATLLAGHPWRRFAVLGDSVAEGIGDPVDGYRRCGLTDRVATALATHRPDLAYLNLGRRDLRAAQVRARQLAAALDFGPDLAMVVCGANDALRPGYDAGAVDAELAAMVTALRDRGAEVLTVSLFILTTRPDAPPRLSPAFAHRMAVLAERTTALAAALGTVHIGLTGHPRQSDPGLLSADGLHGNDRSHAVAAAVAVRRLGAHLAGR